MHNSISLISKKEQHILDNQLEIDWLKRQIEQRKQEAGACLNTKESVQQLTDEQVQEQLETYPERLRYLRKQVHILSQYNLSKSHIADSLNEGHYTLDALYPQDELTDDPSDLKKLHIQDLVAQRDKLVVEEIQLFKQLNEIQKQSIRLQSQTLEKYQENGRLMKDLENLKIEAADRQKQKEKEKEQDVTNGDQVSASSSLRTDERPTEKLHDALNRLEIARNVLMGLILESGIDWASDRKWSRVMLQLGTEEE